MSVFPQLIACAAVRVPYMTANGNHENPYDYASFKVAARARACVCVVALPRYYCVVSC
jgi:hypothetical protein